MDPATWKSFCQSIIDMKGVTLVVEAERVEADYQCSLCAKKWRTALKLDGVIHRAILNVCGGTWKIAEAAREQIAGAVEGSAPPSKVIVNGEEYEVDNG